MNYTDWLRSEFPPLRASTSTETLEYITQAKSETRKLTIPLVFLSAVALIYLMNAVLSSYGFAPFESVVYWVAFIIVFNVGSVGTDKLESVIIKRRLRALVRNNKQG
ncbi:Membrane-associated protein, putative [Shewanella piezotolerans WP3]|uniref:Membrane-associated protein, putative n=1 Tax=Shewanella piezotolerans (strain WP3 / JCM 13877) TaxID=225849 RepID=B8CV28_SHEPW|nr:hypothetical protein [Shewanella piezotolerans]ACJ31504.1 Membrane-associated protein, putative [Shewanella piezotolerans WP3]